MKNNTTALAGAIAAIIGGSSSAILVISGVDDVGGWVYIFLAVTLFIGLVLLVVLITQISGKNKTPIRYSRDDLEQTRIG